MCHPLTLLAAGRQRKLKALSPESMGQKCHLNLICFTHVRPHSLRMPVLNLMLRDKALLPRLQAEELRKQNKGQAALEQSGLPDASCQSLFWCHVPIHTRCQRLYVEQIF